MKASEAKALADAINRIDPPGYAPLTTQINAAATSGVYILDIPTPSNRILSCLLLDGFSVIDIEGGQSRISWQ